MSETRVSEEDSEIESEESEESEEGSDSEYTDEENSSGDEDSSVNGIQEKAVCLDESSSEENCQRACCPVCLNRFIGQDLGIPESCQHIFCLECILEWSKNVNTCPIDRNEFNFVHLKTRPNGKVLRKVPVHVRPREPEEGVATGEEGATLCEVCHAGDREDRLLLCDACDLAYHCDCLDPPLFRVPVEEWFCPPCSMVMRQGGGAAASTVRSRRVIPRTRASESVRVRVQNKRTHLPTVSRSSSTQRPKKRKRRSYRRCIKKVVQLARTKGSAGAGKGKVASNRATTIVVTYRKRRRRKRWRKSKKPTQLPSKTEENNLQSAKGRIAKRLGLCKASKGVSIPDVRSRPGPCRGLSSDRSHSLFGARDQLMDFSENFNEAIAGPSTSGSTYRKLKKTETSGSSTNLLDSILEGQDLLHSKSDNIIIHSDGSLIRKGDVQKKDAVTRITHTSQSAMHPRLLGNDVAPKQTRSEKVGCSSSALLYGALTKKKSFYLQDSISKQLQNCKTADLSNSDSVSTHNIVSSNLQDTIPSHRLDVLQKRAPFLHKFDTQFAVPVTSCTCPNSEVGDSQNSQCLEPNLEISLHSPCTVAQYKEQKEIHNFIKEKTYHIGGSIFSGGSSATDTFTTLQHVNGCIGGVCKKRTLSEDAVDFDVSQSLIKETNRDNKIIYDEKKPELKIKMESSMLESLHTGISNCSVVHDNRCLESSLNTTEFFGVRSESVQSPGMTNCTFSQVTTEVRIKKEPLSSDDEENHLKNDSIRNHLLTNESISDFEPSENLIDSSGCGQFTSKILDVPHSKMGDKKPAFIKKESISSDEESGSLVDISCISDNQVRIVKGNTEAVMVKSENSEKAEISLPNVSPMYFTQSPATQLLGNGLTTTLITVGDMLCTKWNETPLIQATRLACTRMVEPLKKDLPCPQVEESGSKKCFFAKVGKFFDNSPCLETEGLLSKDFSCAQAAEDLPFTQAAEDLPFTQAAEDLPFTQAAEDLTFTQAAGLLTDDLPCSPENRFLTEDLPCTQAAEILEEALPCTKAPGLFAEDLPCTQGSGLLAKGLPCTQAERFLVEDLPCTQAAEILVEDLPCTKAPGSFADLPYTQAADLLAEDLPCTQAAEFFPEDLPYVQAEEDLPCTQGADNLPCTLLAATEQDLTFSQATGLLKVDLSCIQAAEQFEDLPCTQVLDLSSLQSAESLVSEPPCTQSSQPIPVQTSKLSFNYLPRQTSNQPSASKPGLKNVDGSVKDLDLSTTQVFHHANFPMFSDMSTNQLSQDVRLGTDALDCKESTRQLNQNTVSIPKIVNKYSSINVNGKTDSHNSSSLVEVKDSDLSTAHLIKESKQLLEDAHELLEAKNAMALLKNGCISKLVKSPKRVGVHKNLPQVITAVPHRGLLVPKPVNRTTFSFERVKHHFKLNENVIQKNIFCDNDKNLKLPSQTRDKIVTKTKSNVQHFETHKPPYRLSSDNNFKPLPERTCFSSTEVVDHVIHASLCKKIMNGNTNIALNCEAKRSSNCTVGTVSDFKMETSSFNRDLTEGENLPKIKNTSDIKLVKSSLNCKENRVSRFLGVTEKEINEFNEPAKIIGHSYKKTLRANDTSCAVSNTDSFGTVSIIKQAPVEIDVSHRMNEIPFAVKVKNHSDNFGESNMARALRMKREMNTAVMQRNTCLRDVLVNTVKVDSIQDESSNMLRVVPIKREMDIEESQQNLTAKELLETSKDIENHQGITTGDFDVLRALRIKKEMNFEAMRDSVSQTSLKENSHHLERTTSGSSSSFKDKMIERENDICDQIKPIKKECKGENCSGSTRVHTETQGEASDVETHSKSRYKTLCKQVKLNAVDNCIKKSVRDKHFVSKSKSHSLDKCVAEVSTESKSGIRNKYCDKDGTDGSSRTQNHQVEKEKRTNEKNSSDKDSTNLVRDKLDSKGNNFDSKKKHTRKDKHHIRKSSCDGKKENAKKERHYNCEKYDLKDSKTYSKIEVFEKGNSNKQFIKENNAHGNVKGYETETPDKLAQEYDKCDSHRHTKTKETDNHDKETKTFEKCKAESRSEVLEKVVWSQKFKSNKHSNESSKNIIKIHKFEGNICKATKIKQENLNEERKKYCKLDIRVASGKTDASYSAVRSPAENCTNDDLLGTSHVPDPSKNSKKKKLQEDTSIEKRKRSLEFINVNSDKSKESWQNKKPKTLKVVKEEGDCKQNSRNSLLNSKISKVSNSVSGSNRTLKLSAPDPNKLTDTSLGLPVQNTRKMKASDYDKRENKKGHCESMCSEDTSSSFSDHSQLSSEVLPRIAAAAISSSSQQPSLEFKCQEMLGISSADQKSFKMVDRKKELKEEIASKVKAVLKPFFVVGVIDKEDYKDIMRKAVPKVFLNCGNCVNPEKIRKLVLSYVSKLKHS